MKFVPNKKKDNWPADWLHETRARPARGTLGTLFGKDSAPDAVSRVSTGTQGACRLPRVSPGTMGAWRHPGDTIWWRILAKWGSQGASGWPSSCLLQPVRRPAVLFLCFFFGTNFILAFPPVSHQGGSGQQSAGQTPFGKDSLPNGFKLYMQICGETGSEQPQTLQEHQKQKTRTSSLPMGCVRPSCP
jgi:hypothetical protein